jgi:transglutaminase-like putative cysteine protease
VIYRVRHLTEYVYSEAVTTSHHELHLLARSVPGQTIHAERLDVSPEPTVRRDRTDWFGNRCTHLGIHDRHTRLAVTSLLTLEVKPPPPMTSADDRPWESTRDWVRAAESPDARAAIDFVLPSPRIAVAPGSLELAVPSFPAGRPLFDAVRELTKRIHDEFSYDTAATDVSTSVEEVLEKGRGVCQDFAHLQIACLRALGIPARYVSGYLVTARSEGVQRLVGADASHAWVSVRMPGGRWVDFDPTNDVVPTDRHLTIAHGRDFGDVTPMRGVLLGGGRHQLRVGVDVAPTGT